MESEVWVPAYGIPGHEVSSLGRFRSFWVHQVRGLPRGGRRVLGDEPRIINPWPGQYGYLHVSFYGGGGGRQNKKKVHIIVLESFVGPRPPGMHGCHHPDPDRRNNRLENLRWDTRSENMRDMARAWVPGSRPITVAEVPEIWRRLQAGEPSTRIARDYQVHVSAIRGIKHGRSWVHVTRDLPGGDVVLNLSRDQRPPVLPPPEFCDDNVEFWRPVPDFPSYEVSSLGSVKSYSRTRPSAGGLMKLQKLPTKHGYLYVALMKDGRRHPFLVHHLVLTTFVGPRPQGMVACHANDVAGDNRLSNLRWDTRRENYRDYQRREGKI